MPSTAVIAYNVDFSIWNGTAYVQVAEVINVTWPSYTREAVDVTFMDSTTSYREYIAGMQDAGEVTIELNWVPAATHPILTAMTAGIGQFKIQYNAGVNVVFKAIVTSWSTQSPVGEKLSGTATFKITGIPTWSAT